MTDHADGWILAIDFGTSNTAAAIRTGSTNEILELSRGSRTMPSGVILGSSGGPRVGEMAERLRALHPHTYEENPKNLVGMPPQLYDGRPVHAEEFVAEIFREVRRIALDRKAGVEPARVALTHPSAWGGVKTQQLRRAAENAGFDRRSIVLVEEPIAAAHHFRHESAGAPIPIGGQVLVFDFGGGTLDLALVERTEHDDFEVKDIEAIENLGGNNLDEALWDWTLSQIAARNPDAVPHLTSSNGRREEATLRDYVRRAKEDLSFRSATEIPVLVAGYDDTYRPTVEEYEALIRPLVERAVVLTRTLLDRNDDSKVSKFYLTGGSSLTPLVARALAQATGITPTRLGDPKTVVVDGALSAVAAAAPSIQAQPTRPVNNPVAPVPASQPSQQRIDKTDAPPTHTPNPSASHPDQATDKTDAPPTHTPNPSTSHPDQATDKTDAPPTHTPNPSTSHPDQATDKTDAPPTHTPNPSTSHPDQATDKTDAPPTHTPNPSASHPKSTSRVNSVHWAFAAAALLWISGALLLVSAQVGVANGTYPVTAISVSFLFQAAAVAGLFAHHLTRPLKEGRVAAFIYLGLMVTSVVMASALTNPALYTIAHVVFGVLLILIAVLLLMIARRSHSPYIRSLRAPAPWLLAAGASYILIIGASYIVAVSPSSSAVGNFFYQWVWPLAILGVAVGYVISAIRLKRELGNQVVSIVPNVDDKIGRSRA